MHIRKPLPEELPGIGQLVFAAIAAVLISVLLIVTVVLPAERGTDPCLLYTSPSPRDLSTSRMPSSA